MVPIAAGGGLAVRAAFHADDAAKVVSHADDLLRAGNAAANAAQASPWVLGWAERGRQIEKMLGNSTLGLWLANVASNFPVVDYWDEASGLVTSVKSMDLGAQTYQELGRLASTVRSYVDKLRDFAGATRKGFTITLDEIRRRQLILAIPPGATDDQLRVLQELQQWALDNGGVIVTLVTVK